MSALDIVGEEHGRGLVLLKNGLLIRLSHIVGSGHFDALDIIVLKFVLALFEIDLGKWLQSAAGTAPERYFAVAIWDALVS
jgi:hypothetical protein